MSKPEADKPGPTEEEIAEALTWFKQYDSPRFFYGYDEQNGCILSKAYRAAQVRIEAQDKELRKKVRWTCQGVSKSEPCGSQFVIKDGYRCLDCHEWFCPTCARKHLGTKKERDEKAIEAEVERWQERIGKITGKYNVDGGGCESGDPLDFTATEIGLALNKSDDKAFEAEAKVKALERELDRVRVDVDAVLKQAARAEKAEVKLAKIKGQLSAANNIVGQIWKEEQSQIPQDDWTCRAIKLCEEFFKDHAQAARQHDEKLLEKGRAEGEAKAWMEGVAMSKTRRLHQQKKSKVTFQTPVRSNTHKEIAENIYFLETDFEAKAREAEQAGGKP